MEIKFQNYQIQLLPSGALFIPQLNILVCADLHLGKGLLLQEEGVPIAPSIDQQTVEKLTIDIVTYQPHFCIICGDLIHAYCKQIPSCLSWFESQLAGFDIQFILTLGNHDSKKIAPLLKQIKCVPTYQVADLTFSHYLSQNQPTISGHIHPGVKIKKGRIIRTYKAFLVDSFNIVCPSYGYYTGMYSKVEPKFQIYYIQNSCVKRYG